MPLARPARRVCPRLISNSDAYGSSAVIDRSPLCRGSIRDSGDSPDARSAGRCHRHTTRTAPGLRIIDQIRTSDGTSRPLPACTPHGDTGVSDRESLIDVIGHLHQIGWQLRFGEHIEARQQAEESRGGPPLTEAETEEMREVFSGILVLVSDEEFYDLGGCVRHRQPLAEECVGVRGGVGGEVMPQFPFPMRSSR